MRDGRVGIKCIDVVSARLLSLLPLIGFDDAGDSVRHSGSGDHDGDAQPGATVEKPFARAASATLKD